MTELSTKWSSSGKFGFVSIQEDQDKSMFLDKYIYIYNMY